MDFRVAGCALIAMATAGCLKKGHGTGSQAEWTASERERAVDLCREGAEDDSDDVAFLCGCFVGQIEVAYPDPSDIPEQLPAHMQQRAEQVCADHFLSQEQWPQSARDGFLEACSENGNEQAVCDCALEHTESHQTAKEFINSGEGEFDFGPCLDEAEEHPGVVDIE